MSEREFNIYRVIEGLDVNHPFWASLCYNMEWIEDPAVASFKTNGTGRVHYNPKALAGMTKLQQQFCVAHQAATDSCCHPDRAVGLDPLFANQASDYVANGLLVMGEVGSMPAGCLYNPEFDNWTFERVYSKLKADAEQPSPQPSNERDANEPDKRDGPEQRDGTGDNTPDNPDDSQDADDGQSADSEGDGSPSPDDGDNDDGSGGRGGNGQDSVMPGCPTGEMEAAPAPSDREAGEKTAEDWQILVDQAVELARMRGVLGSGVAQAIDAAREPRADWVSETREFLTRSIPTSRSWSTPNRRFIHTGLYLPGDKFENIGVLVLHVDTSGSTIHLRRTFGGELRALVRDVKPEKLIVIHCDAEVQKVVEYDPDDPAVEDCIEMHGGGGTAFQPVIDYIEENGLSPLAVISLTDLEGDHPQDPGIPWLWAVSAHCTLEPPFGRAVKVL